MDRVSEAIRRLLQRRLIAANRARVLELDRAALAPARRPRRDIRVRFFPSSENRGRATRGAEPIASQSGPTGRST